MPDLNDIEKQPMPSRLPPFEEGSTSVRGSPRLAPRATPAMSARPTRPIAAIGAAGGAAGMPVGGVGAAPGAVGGGFNRLTPNPTAGIPRMLAKPTAAIGAEANTVASAFPNSYTLGDGISRTLPSRPVSPATPAAGGLTRLARRPTFNLQPGAANTFTFSTPRPGQTGGESLRAGQTVAVPGLLERQLAARPTPAPMESLGTAAAMTPSARGRQGGIIENPNAMSTTDRMRIASMDAKGSPTLRRALLEQIASEDQRGEANFQGAQAENAAADLAAANNLATAQQATADRQLQARRLDVEATNAAADRSGRLEEARIARRPVASITAEDGSVGRIGEDGNWAPITDASGKPVRPVADGALSQSDILKAYTDQRTAILQSDALGPQVQTQLDALDNSAMGQRYLTMMGGTSSAGPTFEQFVTDVKQKGSKLSDEQLRAYFDDNYGD